MASKVLFFLSYHLTFVLMLIHKKPIAKEVWSGHCTMHSMVLNDCNWCICDKTHKYTCKARVCDEVDMFGHFNDAIQDLHVGIEGRGSWRSTETPCEPGIRYQKDNLLCVCGEDGNWPNPVCRDIFQILHSVELMDEKLPRNQHCSPGRLHLIGCNVCFCPSNGRINSELCTKKDCENDKLHSKVSLESNELVDEIYAECLVDTNYKFGCKSCICLRNNRLLCDNCTETTSDRDFCSKKDVGKIFAVDCNSCYCSSEGLINCTVKKCLDRLHTKGLAKSLTLPDMEFKMIEKPLFIQECVPGTMYKNDCNKCYCFNKNGLKLFGCTLNRCPGSEDEIRNNCVIGTIYEKDCLICHCELLNGVKTEICQLNQICINEKVNRGHSSLSLRSRHGFCEPLYVYQKDCNKCVCSEDGMFVQCTVKNCENDEVPLTLDIVPVIQNIGDCPKGHTYRVGCNTCVCLSKNSVICSAAVCKKSD